MVSVALAVRDGLYIDHTEGTATDSCGMHCVGQRLEGSGGGSQL